jgi:hypothetical protein
MKILNVIFDILTIVAITLLVVAAMRGELTTWQLVINLIVLMGLLGVLAIRDYRKLSHPKIRDKS